MSLFKDSKRNGRATQCGHADLTGHGAAPLKPEELGGGGRSDNTGELSFHHDNI